MGVTNRGVAVKWLKNGLFLLLVAVVVVAEIAPRPILFIHGEADGVIPVENAYRLYAAADNPAAELWVVPGADHVRAYKAHRQEYVARVTAFFDVALGVRLTHQS